MKLYKNSEKLKNLKNYKKNFKNLKNYNKNFKFSWAAKTLLTTQTNRKILNASDI